MVVRAVFVIARALCVVVVLSVGKHEIVGSPEEPDLTVISVSSDALAHRRNCRSAQSAGDLPLGLLERGCALIQERSALTRSEPESTPRR